VTKLLIFDCDSTLSTIEGIDELGRLRGPEAARQVEEMTRMAMDGQTAIDSIFGRRLEIIRPSRQEVAAVGQLYRETLVLSAREAVESARAAGWQIAIVSGGFREAILPLAEDLGIDRVEAVSLRFNPDGSYAGFNATSPTARAGGKPEVARRLRAETGARIVALVGDGASDLEAKAAVDCFIGYGGVARRTVVEAGADQYLMDLAQLSAALAQLAMAGPRR
jgi:phosphoserine phosphatase